MSLDANSKNLVYWDAWRFSLESPISFFRPQQAPFLSLVETIVAIGIRVAGALLVALAVAVETKRGDSTNWQADTIDSIMSMIGVGR